MASSLITWEKGRSLEKHASEGRIAEEWAAANQLIFGTSFSIDKENGLCHKRIQELRGMVPELHASQTWE
jgi:hypothetical protein